MKKDMRKCDLIIPILLALLSVGSTAWMFIPEPPPNMSDYLPPPSESIRTQGGFTAEQLVKDIFAKGACENISNITRIGHADGVGYFENGSPSIGVDRGIILATGPLVNAEGPNSVTDKSGDFNGPGGDPDLAILATGQVNDAVGLAFDFVPLDSFVSFSYVFASEEYCEFVGSQYNDVFGFFIRGPGISGGFTGNAQNVALIPGTSDFVSINSVNHNANSGYYISNERSEDAADCNIPYSNSPNQERIEYDGFTRRLTAILKLNPCETYRIRLVVSDVGDPFYDSAVFLEAGSFNLGGAVKLTSAVTGNPQDPVYEGCANGYFRFVRENTESLDFPLTVNYKFSESSTATPGLDFTSPGSSITIPAGDSIAILPIQTLNDAIGEGPEDLIMLLDIPCACYSDSATMRIIEAPTFSVDLPDAVVCPNTPELLYPSVEGGVPGYQYLWADQSTDASLLIDDQLLQTSVTVTDACGHTASDDAAISTNNPPTAALSGDVQLCDGDTAYLRIDFTGIAPWSLIYRVNGANRPLLDNIMDNPYFLPVTEDGTHEIEFFTDFGCEGLISGVGMVKVNKINLEQSTIDASCSNEADGSISLSFSGGLPPYTIAWADTTYTGANRNNLLPGSYTVSITDALGCQKVSTFTIGNPPPLLEVQIDCEQLSTGNLQLEALGGLPPYRYGIDGGPLQDESIFGSLQAGESYELLIEDASGCQLVQDFLMPTAVAELFSFPPTIEVRLGEVHPVRPQLHIPEALIDTISWLPPTNLSCTDCLSPEHTAQYEEELTLRIVDVFGCSHEASVTVLINLDIDVFVPNAFSPNGDHVNDFFTVFADPAQVTEVLEFNVFDRWGAQMYHAEDFPPNENRKGWDGSFRGKKMDSGVYVYFARLLLADGSETIVKGAVALLR